MSTPNVGRPSSTPGGAGVLLAQPPDQFAGVDADGAGSLAHAVDGAALDGFMAGVTGGVSNPADIERMIQKGTHALDDLSVFTANAGIVQVHEILDVKPEALDRMVGVNIKGVYHSCQPPAHRFIAQGTGGKTIAAASIAAFRPFPLLTSCSATNSAVRGLTQAAAAELAKHKITVNA